MIKLAYDDPFPPFSFTRKGRAEGMIIDILSEVLKKVKVTFIPSPMKDIENLLNTNRVDGISFYGVNPWRKEIFDFSNPIIPTGGALFTKSSKPSNPELMKFEGVKVVTPRKGPLKDYIQKEFPKVVLFLVDDYFEALETVLKEEADGAALNIHVGINLINQLFPGLFTIPDRVFLKIDLATAVLKGKHPSLLEDINRGLKEIKENWIYDEIVEKWIGHFPVI